MSIVGQVDAKVLGKDRKVQKVDLLKLKAILRSSPNMQEMMMALRAKMDRVVELANGIDKKAKRNGDSRKDKDELKKAREAVFYEFGAIYKKMSKLNGEASIEDKLSLVVASDEAYENGIISFSPYMFYGDKVVKVGKTNSIVHDYFPTGAFC